MKNLSTLIAIICLSSFAWANTIVTSSVTGGPFCGGASVSVSYTVDGNFNSGNFFTAQLSDKKGNFDNPIDIGSIVSTTSGTIPSTIPMNMATGSAYKIRVIASDPSTIGSPCQNDIRINPAPKGLTISDVTTTGFTLSWNSVKTADYYQVTGKLHRSERYPKPVDVTGGALSYTFTDLKPGHDYDLGVRAVCSNGDKSAWNPTTASTDSEAVSTCETPANLFVSDIGVTTSSLEWSDVDGAMDYSFRYHTRGATDWIYFHPTESHIDLTGLLPAQDYEAQVATRCSPTDSSAYGNTATWQTNYFRLAMESSEISIYPNPSNGNFTISLNHSFSGELSIVIQNVLGQVVYQSNRTLSEGANQNISVDNLDAGIYLVNIKAGNDELHSSIAVQ